MADGFYPAGVNRAGSEAASDNFGTSRFIDPIGEVISQAGDTDEILLADLPAQIIEQMRRI